MSQTQAQRVRSDICRERLRVLSSDLTVATWADRYRFLSSESAAIYGKWSTLPFQRGPLEAVSDRKVYRVVVKSATQMLKWPVYMMPPFSRNGRALSRRAARGGGLP